MENTILAFGTDPCVAGRTFATIGAPCVAVRLTAESSAYGRARALGIDGAVWRSKTLGTLGAPEQSNAAISMETNMSQLFTVDTSSRVSERRR
jgi:hypothetical protein